jgi:hypothetical protein
MSGNAIAGIQRRSDMGEIRVEVKYPYIEPERAMKSYR